jgi:hypothetical protein
VATRTTAAAARASAAARVTAAAGTTAGTEDHVADPVADRTQARPEDHVADPVANSQDHDEADDPHHLLPARCAGGRGAVGSHAGVFAGVGVGERLWHACLLCHVSVASVTMSQIAESTGMDPRINRQDERTVRWP